MLSMSPDAVHCIYVDGAGCYGRNGHEDAAADSALLSKAIGKPVRVQWSRADEHGWDPKGAPTLIDLRATVDGGGIHTTTVAGVGIPITMAAGAGTVAGDLVGITGIIGASGDLERGFGPFPRPFSTRRLRSG